MSSHTQINGKASTAGVGQTLLAYTDLSCLIFCTDCSLVLFRDLQKSLTPQVICLQENLSSLFFKDVHSPYVWRKPKQTKNKQTKPQSKTNKQTTQKTTKKTHKTNQDSWEFLKVKVFILRFPDFSWNFHIAGRDTNSVSDSFLYTIYCWLHPHLRLSWGEVQFQKWDL